MTLTIKLNETFSAGEHRITLNGSYDARFEPVLDAFIQNYRVEDDVGSASASSSTTHVSIWGGC